MSSDPMQRRLERLEKRNQYLLLACGVLLGLVVGLVLPSDSRPSVLPRAYAQGVTTAESGQVFTTSSDGKTLTVWAAGAAPTNWKGTSFKTR